MHENLLFTMALGLTSPWGISKVELSNVSDGTEEEEITEKALHLTIDHGRGERFEYEGTSYPVYDHQERTWRHLNFFEHTCYIHARVPRIKLSNGKAKLISVPWAKQGGSFTLLFEAYTALLVKNGMSHSKAGEYVNESNKVVYRLIKSMVVEALANQPLESVKELGVDETSSKKGHNYLTILTDRERKKVVGISNGKSAASMVEALEEMAFRAQI